MTADRRSGAETVAAADASSPPVDQAFRDRAVDAIDVSCLVEAGAGSGKTTLIVKRLLRLIAAGRAIDTIAAVTFTRKAATELRERFEDALDGAAASTRDPVEQERYRVAHDERARGFIGTIHAFCSRVLREYALEVGLPPDFTELDDEETTSLRAEFWRTYLADADAAPDLTALETLGIAPVLLQSAFARYEQFHDARFPVPSAPQPAHEGVRDRLVRLLDKGYALHQRLGAQGTDALRHTLDVLWRGYRAHGNWASPADFAHDSARLLTASKRKLTQKHWASRGPGNDDAKDYAAEVDAFADGELLAWHEAWRAFCYPTVIGALGAASRRFAVSRRRRGLVAFDDLLLLTTRLLRERDDVREAVGRRWRHLLVDEFQDTDPLQAELCFLIASEPSEGNAWQSVTPRPGSLFVVGDPKQSIYRFRRADIATYRIVEQRLVATGGEKLPLTANFRSVSEIGDVVDAAFATRLSGAAGDVDPVQAPYAPLRTRRVAPTDGDAPLGWYEVTPPGGAKKHDVRDEDARRVASWIAAQLDRGTRRAESFLVLTRSRDVLAAYAAALAERGVPVRVDGATLAVDDVLSELSVLVDALRDPDDPVRVLAALEGVAGGCTLADLYEAHQAGVPWRLSSAPPASAPPVVRDALAQLHAWWQRASSRSADVLLEELLDESGLLAWAAGGPLGDQRAGLLLHIVERVRAGVPDVVHLEAIRHVLDTFAAQELPDAPLRSGARDAVQVMNLHKAKGLEAEVVVLAAPLARRLPVRRGTDCAVWRDAAGELCAALAIVDDSNRLVAAPADWEARASREIERLDAENVRLEYVATTRARDALLVATRPASESPPSGMDFPWTPIVESLEHLSAPRVELPLVAPVGRPTLAVSPSTLAARGDDAQRARRQAAAPSLVRAPITRTVGGGEGGSSAGSGAAQYVVDEAEGGVRRVAPDDDAAMSAPDASPSTLDDTLPATGRVWGDLVHRAIEGALRGRAGEALRAWCEALVFHEPAVRDATERERLVVRLVALANAARARADIAGAARVQPELGVARFAPETRALAEGILDALVENADGSPTVLDWKTDGRRLAADTARAARYDRQIARYATIVAARAHRDVARTIVAADTTADGDASLVDVPPPPASH